MNDDHTTGPTGQRADRAAGDHPWEQLATYAEEAATPEERAIVEAHVAGCAACRTELGQARMARSALTRMQELPAPGVLSDVRRAVARERRGTFERPAVAPLAARREERAGRMGRFAWGAGLAAAAVVVGVLVVQSLGGGGGEPLGGGAGGGVGAGVGAPNGPPVVERDARYTAGSVNALAAHLAVSPSKDALASAEAPGSTPGGPSGTGLQRTVRAPDVIAAATACVRQGSGMTGAPFYLEQATYTRTPAYLGGFLTPSPGSPTHVVVVVVRRSDCQPLYVVRQAL